MISAVLFVVAVMLMAAAIEYLVDEWRALLRTLRRAAGDAP